MGVHLSALTVDGLGGVVRMLDTGVLYSKQRCRTDLT